MAKETYALNRGSGDPAIDALPEDVVMTTMAPPPVPYIGNMPAVAAGASVPSEESVLATSPRSMRRAIVGDHTVLGKPPRMSRREKEVRDELRDDMWAARLNVPRRHAHVAAAAATRTSPVATKGDGRDSGTSRVTHEDRLAACSPVSISIAPTSFDIGTYSSAHVLSEINRQAAELFNAYTRHTDEKEKIAFAVSRIITKTSPRATREITIIDIGCGNMNLASMIIARLNAGGFFVNYYGVEEDKEHIIASRLAVTELDISRSSIRLIEADCFDATGAVAMEARLPETADVILLSHVGYFAKTESDMDWLANKLLTTYPGGIKIFIHQPLESQVADLRERYKISDGAMKLDVTRIIDMRIAILGLNECYSCLDMPSHLTIPKSIDELNGSFLARKTHSEGSDSAAKLALFATYRSRFRPSEASRAACDLTAIAIADDREIKICIVNRLQIIFPEKMKDVVNSAVRGLIADIDSNMPYLFMFAKEGNLRAIEHYVTLNGGDRLNQAIAGITPLMVAVAACDDYDTKNSRLDPTERPSPRDSRYHAVIQYIVNHPSTDPENIRLAENLALSLKNMSVLADFRSRSRAGSGGSVHGGSGGGGGGESEAFTTASSFTFSEMSMMPDLVKLHSHIHCLFTKELSSYVQALLQYAKATKKESLSAWLDDNVDELRSKKLGTRSDRSVAGDSLDDTHHSTPLGLTRTRSAPNQNYQPRETSSFAREIERMRSYSQAPYIG